MPAGRDSMAAGKRAWWRKLRSLILKHKHETKRVNRDITLPAKLYLPNLRKLMRPNVQVPETPRDVCLSNHPPAVLDGLGNM